MAAITKSHKMTTMGLLSKIEACNENLTKLNIYVSHLGMLPLPKNTNMATMALPFKRLSTKTKIAVNMKADQRWPPNVHSI